MFSKMFGIVIALVIATSFMYTNVAKAEIIQDGLVSYWSFDEDSIDGDTVRDIFGNNDGTLRGAPEIVAGKRKEALDFEGLSADCVEVGATEELSPMSGSCTILMWVHLRGQDFGGVFNNFGPDGAAKNEIRKDPDVIDVEIRDSARNEHRVRPAMDWDVWVYIAYVWNHETNTLSFYMDGENVAESTKELGVIDNSATPLFIGNNMNLDYAVNGMIDEVCYYSRALSKAEIEQNFQASVEGTLFSSAAVTPSDKLSIMWGEIKRAK